MPRQRILLSWVGHTDLNAWADANPAAAELLADPQFEQILREERFKRNRVSGVGALKAAAEAREFDAIHLLSRMPQLDHAFAKWLGVDVKLHEVKRDNPTDYGAVYREADRVLRQIRDEHELNFLLTSGTPTMAAIWVLLGTTLHPATLWQSTPDGKLTKTDLPFDLTLLERQIIQRVDVALLSEAGTLPSSFEQIVGSGNAIMNAKRLAAVVARHDVCVLLLGEPGTGKELFAKAIHEASQRSKGPFEIVNCAGIPDDLLESELFGHKKGSFTGAFQDKKGRFELANKGTLFLDEVGECSSNMQRKLLRVLQPPAGNLCHREFRPVGEEKDKHSDVRIIAATNRNLRAMVAEGEFRDDLYFRLRDMKIKLPSLRQRQSDIPEIAASLIQEIRRALRLEGGKRAMQLSQDAIRFAQTWNWVGNVRELKSALRQAAMFTTGEEITRSDLEMAAMDVDDAGGTVGEFVFRGPMPVTEYLEGMRRKLFREALTRTEDNQSEAAKLLGVTPAAVSKFVRQQEVGGN